MMKRLFPLLASFMLLASPADALKMIIWDRDMQTTLGAGESSGSKFNAQLIKDYSGPVVVIFSQTDEEKRNFSFAGLQNRYDGILKNGVLTLMPETNDKQDKNKLEPRTGNAQTTSISGFSPASKTVNLTLPKLLQQFKLTVVQTTSQTDPAHDMSGTASTASGVTVNNNFKSLDLKAK